MNGEKGGIKIDVPLPPYAVAPESIVKTGGNRSFRLRKWFRDVWDFAKEDRNRVTFGLKVGLAVLLVSLLILIREPCNVFRTNNIIWALLTAVVMFEYTVGETFNRGFNRAVGSLLAGIFVVVVIQVTMASGRAAEPYIIGFTIFLVGTVTSFMRQWPSLLPYESGLKVVFFTYCLIIISGYRMGNPLRTAMDRLYSIMIGGITAVLVNVLVVPVWAGEQLHKELVDSFTSVADALEECVNKYLMDDGFSEAIIDDDFADEPAFRKCRAALNSPAKLESLAVSAKWEPPHGRFLQLLYPWPNYVKAGAVLLHCAYEVMALHGCLHSEIQAPCNLRITFQSEILDATSQAVELLRSLGNDISNMKRSLKIGLLKRVHSSTERLQRSIDLHSYLLTSAHDLYDFSNYTEPGSEAEPTVQAQSYHHESMKRQQRRLHSWPSREVDEFEEDGGNDGGLITSMHTLEGTAALSLATFTSLLIEFVARLDHLVDVVDELAKMAKFKQECTS